MRGRSAMHSSALDSTPRTAVATHARCATASSGDAASSTTLCQSRCTDSTASRSAAHRLGAMAAADGPSGSHALARGYRAPPLTAGSDRSRLRLRRHASSTPSFALELVLVHQPIERGAVDAGETRRLATCCRPPAPTRRVRYSFSNCAITWSFAGVIRLVHHAGRRPRCSAGRLRRRRRRSGCRSAESSWSGSASTATCSITFCSSRTLPRHGRERRNAMLASLSFGSRSPIGGGAASSG